MVERNNAIIDKNLFLFVFGYLFVVAIQIVPILHITKNKGDI